MAIHPAGIKNTFASHLVFWALFLPLMTLIFIPLFKPEQNIDPAEVRMLQGLNVDVSQLTERANATFSSAFIVSGIMPATEDFFIKEPVQGRVTSPSTTVKWIRGVWLMTYKFIWRVHALWQIFLLPLVALSIPAIIDGIAVRSKKKFSFDRSNPIFFYASTHLVTLVIGLFVFLPLSPMTLTTNLMVAMLVGLTFAIWVASANFQTGV